MKFTKYILAAVAVCSIAITASAAQFGLDPYMGFRAVVASTTPTIVNVTNVATPVSTGPVDKLNWIGDAKFDVFVLTNSAPNTLKLTLQQSTDSTNWTSVTNISVATLTSVAWTNPAPYYNGTYYFTTGATTNGVNPANCPIVTDNYLYPFSITTPQAFFTGYAAPYTYENQFTNSTVTLNVSGWTEFAIHAQDSARYLQLIYTAAGTGATNITTSTLITVPTSNIQP